MVLVVAALAGGAQAAHADPNFLGKTITIFIGYGVGGSYHFTRNCSHWPDHRPA